VPCSLSESRSALETRSWSAGTEDQNVAGSGDELSARLLEHSPDGILALLDLGGGAFEPDDGQ
jgi:hypothetical protein